MKRAIFAVLVATAFLAAVLLGLYPQALEPASVRDFILAFGLAAPIVFAAIYAIAVFIPYGTTLLSVVAGLAFGTIWGGLLTFAITLFASLAPMALARTLGREWVEGKIGNTRVKKYADLINRNAFLVFFYLRLIPSIPYEVQNYIAGITRIRYREFFLASVLGNGPIIFILTFLGDGLTDPGSVEFWIAAGIFIAAISAPPVIGYVFKRRGKRPLLARLASPDATGS